MTIQAILKNKGAEVVAIDAAHQVAEAVRTMDKRQIGALVVTGQGEDCRHFHRARRDARAGPQWHAHFGRFGGKIYDRSTAKHFAQDIS